MVRPLANRVHSRSSAGRLPSPCGGPVRDATVWQGTADQATLLSRVVECLRDRSCSACRRVSAPRWPASLALATQPRHGIREDRRGCCAARGFDGALVIVSALRLLTYQDKRQRQALPGTWHSPATPRAGMPTLGCSSVAVVDHPVPAAVCAGCDRIAGSNVQDLDHVRVPVGVAVVVVDAEVAESHVAVGIEVAVSVRRP